MAVVLELFLVLADLPDHLVDHQVDRLIHVLGGLDGFQDISGSPGHMHGELGDLHVLQALVPLGAELHTRLEDMVEMAC